MSVSSQFSYSSLFLKSLPPPTPRFGGLAKYVMNSGHNDPEFVPKGQLVEAARRVIDREGHKLAIYNLSEGPLGYSGLRKFFAEKLRLRGVTTTPDDILVTSGSGQAIDLVFRTLIQPGDTVIFEEFSYLGAINKARAMGAKVVSVSLDEDGIRMDALSSVLADLKSKGVRPKLIYTIPTVQNPTGTIMPIERRREFIQIARSYGVPIIEDECYSDIIWSGRTPPALYGMAPDEVIYIGSLSKTLVPAIRLGYVAAPWPVLSQLLSLKSDGGTGALDQMIAAEYLSQEFEAHTKALTSRLKQKCDILVEAVEREFGASAHVWKPEGGIFVWVRLEEAVDTRTLVDDAAKSGLVFNPGPEWAIDGDKSASYLRLCFALPTKSEIEEGVALLAQICHEKTGVPARGANKIR